MIRLCVGIFYEEISTGYLNNEERKSSRTANYIKSMIKKSSMRDYVTINIDKAKDKQMYANRYANEKRMDKKAKTHAADGALRQDLANFRKKE